MTINCGDTNNQHCDGIQLTINKQHTSEMFTCEFEINNSTYNCNTISIISSNPSMSPTIEPTLLPTVSTTLPSINPTKQRTPNPSGIPTLSPTLSPAIMPHNIASFPPTTNPTDTPSLAPSNEPTKNPTHRPTYRPSISPIISTTILSHNNILLHNPTKTVSLKLVIIIGSLIIGCIISCACFIIALIFSYHYFNGLKTKDKIDDSIEMNTIKKQHPRYNYSPSINVPSSMIPEFIPNVDILSMESE